MLKLILIVFWLLFAIAVVVRMPLFAALALGVGGLLAVMGYDLTRSGTRPDQDFVTADPRRPGEE